MKTWFTMLAALLALAMCRCATWPDEDAFDRLVVAIDKAKSDAKSGDAAAGLFINLLNESVKRGRIIKVLQKLPDDRIVSELRCFDDRTGDEVEVPPSPDNSVTAAQMIECIIGAAEDPYRNTFDLWKHCVNYITDGDYRAQEMYEHFLERDRIVACRYHIAPEVEKRINWNTNEFSAVELTQAFLGLKEPPRDWNWSWVKVNILDSAPAGAFPGCSLCSDSPLRGALRPGGDK